MHRIAKFHFVSPAQFMTAMQEEYPKYTEEQIKEMYEALKLPKRATKGSAGYDFFAPFTFKLTPGETIKIPTGIRAEMQEDWVLQIYPRSGLGFKYRLQMNNTVGIIDSDYFFSDNEGHIFMKITNDSNEARQWRSLQEPDLPREFSCSTVSQRTMMRKAFATVASEVLQNNS
jgi:dUTP pyrophosphatase